MVATRTVLRCCAAFLLTALAFGAFAQERYPSRPIEVVVPWGPGGGSDQTARRLAQHLESALKVSLPVVNVPGASGLTGVTKIFNAPADGYTIGVTGDIYAPMGAPGAKYKLADFIPLAIVISQPGAFFTAQDSRFKTWADFEKEARAKPGALKIAFVGFNSIDEIHINNLIAKGIRVTAVPFAKPGERYASVLGGHADLVYEQAGDVRSFLTGKQLRALLSISEKRQAAFADVPTAREVGIDITVPQFRWVFMRGGTDPKRAEVVAATIARYASTPDYKKYLEEEWADPESFVPMAEAPKRFQQSLEALRREATAAGMKTAQ
ncbi:MAG: tripartite tricarboxylate transporter substrate binding protein [Betaproteobacteria bacterium]|nr:tripartite tricarboxylate transporter substrate binding protein [Betaproteobacteria bacterium]